MSDYVSPTTRRTLLAGSAAGAVAILAACGDDKADMSGDANTGSVVGKAADVPVGGGKIFPDKGLVVLQPTAGEYKAFSAICTHQGCNVSEVTKDKITCACHGSVFSTEDGSVLTGPAKRALAAKNVKVDGGEIKLA